MAWRDRTALTDILPTPLSPLSHAKITSLLGTRPITTPHLHEPLHPSLPEDHVVHLQGHPEPLREPPELHPRRHDRPDAVQLGLPLADQRGRVDGGDAHPRGAARLRGQPLQQNGHVGAEHEADVDDVDAAVAGEGSEEGAGGRGDDQRGARHAAQVPQVGGVDVLEERGGCRGGGGGERGEDGEEREDGKRGVEGDDGKRGRKEGIRREGRKGRTGRSGGKDKERGQGGERCIGTAVK